MAINNKINILIEATDNTKKAIANVSSGFGKMNTSIQKNADKFKKLGVLGAGAVTGIGLGIKNLVSQASDLEETTQKFNVVYSKMGDEATATAKKIADGYGLSQSASKQFLADLGDVTSGFGLSQEASLKYAEDVTKLGVDLASFGNIAGGSEEAIDRLNKGLLGEHENLKALGIIINDSMLKKQLLADGTAELTGLELEQAKIQARMTIAVSQSTNAIGDFERSKKSLANQTRIVQAKMEDLTTNLGQAFLPVITSLVSSLEPLVSSFAKWAGDNPELVKTLGLIALGVAGVTTAIGALGLIIGPITAGVTALGTAFTFLMANPIVLFLAGIVSAGVLVYKNWDKIVAMAGKLGVKIEWLGEKFKKAWEFIKKFTGEAITDITDNISGLIDKVGGFGGEIADGLSDGLASGKKKIENTVSGLSSTISDYLGFHSPTKKGAGSDADKWMPNLVDMISDGLENGESDVEKSAEKLGKNIKKGITAFDKEGLKTALSEIKMNALSMFDSISGQLTGQKTNVQSLVAEYKQLKTELKDIEANIQQTGEQGTTDIAKRAVEINKELAEIKQKIADNETEGTEDEKEKLKIQQEKLENELNLAKAYVTTNDIKNAQAESEKSETQLIVEKTALKIKEQEAEKVRLTELAQLKKEEAIKEATSYNTLVNLKKSLDEQYFKIFDNHIKAQTNQTETLIEKMKNLIALTSASGMTVDAGLGTDGERALGGTVQSGKSYLVGENGPELFTPPTTGRIQPNGSTSGSANININMGGVTVTNQADENRLVAKIQSELKNQMQMYKLGIS